VDGDEQGGEQPAGRRTHLGTGRVAGSRDGGDEGGRLHFLRRLRGTAAAVPPAAALPPAGTRDGDWILRWEEGGARRWEEGGARRWEEGGARRWERDSGWEEDFSAREKHSARALKTWPPAKNLRALKFCRLRARLRRLRAANSPPRRA
jgi:hypothetical protein